MHLTNRRRKEIASLGQKKYRDRLGQMLIEGVRSVASALDAGAPLLEVVVAEGALSQPEVQALTGTTSGPVYVLPDAEVERLSEVRSSQGVLAVARTDLIPAARLAGLQTVLVLDGVQDPGNVGTLVRTAGWFGAQAVLAGPGTADFFNPKAVRAAMGGLWDVRLARTDHLAATLDDLHAARFHLYGADLEGTAVHTWAPRTPSALVFGSEAHGLSAAVAQRLDERVAIGGAPTRAGTESLNVAVAAGILVYEWLGAGP